MEKIREGLITLFEGMLPQVSNFKRKTYADVFEESWNKYRQVVDDITDVCSEQSEEACDQIIEELAAVIPDYAYEKMKSQPKSKQGRMEVDFNMNMAAYVVPMLTYTKNENCQKLSEKMIELWNAKGITALQLSPSSYEVIAGGFRKGVLGFCYITTAVCENKNKPDDCYELTTLRSYRDGYLMQTEEGAELVEEYYDTAPFLVQILQMQPDADSIYEDIYQTYLMPCIQCIEQEKNEECKRIYVDMVRKLQKKYLYS